MSTSLAAADTGELMERKDALARALLARLTRLGIAPDYAYPLMIAARSLPDAERLALLEELVEIEAIKYTLAARRVRELDPEEQP